ncbi:hypothetical protein DL95DRAFT_510138 [Leptodontidium sp. 2 PMI_412]|nr:hypothetical protein DL95DRAFT_510138 [Leptodontidium sp. 2 PMI_412]
MYHSAMAAAGGGPVAGQDRTLNTKKGHTSSDTLHTSNAGLQVSTAANHDVPLEPATGSPSISSAYIHDQASTSSLLVNAGSYISVSETSHIPIGNGHTSHNAAQGTSLFSVNNGGSTVPPSIRSNTLNQYTSQPQIWLYETSPTNQTLAEHLEQTNWERQLPSSSYSTRQLPHPHKRDVRRSQGAGRAFGLV